MWWQNKEHSIIWKIRWLQKDDMSEKKKPYFAKMKDWREWDWEGQRGNTIFDTFQWHFVSVERTYRTDKRWETKPQMIMHLVWENGDNLTLECNMWSVPRQLLNRIATLKKIWKIKLVLWSSFGDIKPERFAWICVYVDWVKLDPENVAISKKEQEQLIEKEATRKWNFLYYDKMDDKLFEICAGIQSDLQLNDQK